MMIEEFCFKLLGFINLWWEKKVAPTGCKMTKEFWIEKQIELIAADLRNLIREAVEEAIEKQKQMDEDIVRMHIPD